MQGVLLAAGFGRRFQVEGGPQQDKLLTCLPNQQTILFQSAIALISVLPDSIAVVQPYQTERKVTLQGLGFQIVESGSAKDGIGYAIADAIKATSNTEGWLIALADMPWVNPLLIQQLSESITTPGCVAAPKFDNKRGQPVAFGSGWFERLASLKDDAGARELLKTAEINWIYWHNASIHRDVDRPQDVSD